MHKSGGNAVYDRTLLDARSLTLHQPTDDEIDTVAKDALAIAIRVSRTQLPPEIARRFDDPSIDDARLIVRDTFSRFAASFRGTIRLSDLASWAVPAILAFGLHRDHPEAIFRWPDGSPIAFAGRRLITR